MNKRASEVARTICTGNEFIDRVYNFDQLYRYLSSLPEFSDRVPTALWKELRAREAEMKKRVNESRLSTNSPKDESAWKLAVNQAASNGFENAIEIILRHIANPIKEDSPLVQFISGKFHLDAKHISTSEIIEAIKEFEKNEKH